MKEKYIIYWLIIDKPKPNLQFKETLASITRQSLESRYNEAPRDRLAKFSRYNKFRYIEVKQNHSLYRVLRYIEGSTVFDYFI